MIRFYLFYGNFKSQNGHYFPEKVRYVWLAYVPQNGIILTDDIRMPLAGAIGKRVKRGIVIINDIKKEKRSVEELRYKKEDQTYDRKSARKEPKSLSNHIVAFANADGGTIVIGIEDDAVITGIDDYAERVNDILRVPYDYCKPSVNVNFEIIKCIDYKGEANHLLIINIPQSPELHANQEDEVYYRMGDKSKRMSFEDRLRLMYSKGSRYYEDEPVADSSIDDIDLDFVAAYCKKIGYKKTALEYIRQNRDFVISKGGREEMSGAAILLFGKNPQRFFQRARVRFTRYEGNVAKVGPEMNVIKDKFFTGRILDMVEQAIAFVRDQIKERTFLGKDGKFVTTPEYPEFAWKELIINAIAHRDYSIKGTDIQIKMFNDRILVESPGDLPGIVRLTNMREFHFSRNPKIAAFLHDYEYVEEFGEGIDRMFNEMEKAGLPAPEYRNESFMLNAVIRNGVINDTINETKAENETINDTTNETKAENETINDTTNETKAENETINDTTNEIKAENETINDTINDTINEIITSGGTINDTINEIITSDDTINFTEVEWLILNFVTENAQATINEIVSTIGKSKSTVNRVIKNLKDNGRLKRIGGNKNGRWIVMK